MDLAADILLTDLRRTVADLGKDGGLISPSIYDTAQALRLAPPPEGPWPGLAWLLDQQQPDGGWGDQSVPRARDVPTLAAMLALHTYGTRASERQAVRAGVAFLQRQAAQWWRLPDDLPVGVELLLPDLLDEAASMGLDIAPAPYAALLALGRKRRQMIAARQWDAGTPPIHSWEAWGAAADSALLDGSGGVGHSPAATAAWLRAAGDRAELSEERAAARAYLDRAAAATGLGIPGIVPTVWPIVRFEQSFALYVLLIAGLLDHPALRDAVEPQLADLARALGPNGLGMSDYFLPDGDDTAAALAVLHAAGKPADVRLLHKFAAADHFCAYQGELHPSLSVTAHAVHLLSLAGLEYDRSHNFVAERQGHDGRWLGDKWNGSWLYTTAHAIVAMQHAQASSAIDAAVAALLLHQHEDGGWGMHESTPEETAHAILALRGLGGELTPAARPALERGEQWMLASYRPFHRSQVTCWLGKEMYRPYRLARVIELAATLPHESRSNVRVAA
jgi:hypothetical protein